MMLYTLKSIEVIDQAQYLADDEASDGAAEILDYQDTFEVSRYDWQASFSSLLPKGFVLTSEYYHTFTPVTCGTFEYNFVLEWPGDYAVKVRLTDEYEYFGEDCDGFKLPYVEPPYCIPSSNFGCVFLVLMSEPKTVADAVGLLRRFENDIWNCAWQLRR